MDDKIRKAFDGIRAEEELKEKTKKAIFQRANRQQKKYENRKRRRKPLYLSIAFCFALLAAVGGYRLYFLPTSVISIDINPSVELSVNRFDRVIDVEGYNEDGENLSESVDVMYMNYGSALDEILQSDTVTECLEEGEYLSIAVIPDDEKQGEAILKYASACTDGQENANCYSMAKEEAEHAHSLGLSYGKYRVYKEIASCCGEDAVTPEEAGEMTMKELKEYLEQYQQDEESRDTKEDISSYGQQTCMTGEESEMHGNGHGNRHGHEQE